MGAARAVDVVIVGGGPAGSTVASVLARGGVRAVVLERDAFPRFHIGESMLPQSMRVWDRIGVTKTLRARFLEKHGARFVCCTTGAETSYEFEEAFDPGAPHAFQVPRAEFDDVLLRHAEGLGAEVRHGWEATGLVREGDAVRGVRARDREGGEHTLRARVVVDATGRDGLVAGSLARRARFPGLDKTAFFAHWRGVPRREGRAAGHIDILVFHPPEAPGGPPAGWFWNIPFKDGVNSTGFVCGRTWIERRAPGEGLDAFFDRTVAAAPGAARLLAGATRLVPVRAAADYSYRIDRMCGDGWVMVGDAGGFIDPLFSTGAHLAFGGGARAADVILAALGGGGDAPLPGRAFETYEAEVRRAAELFAGAVQAFYDGELARLVFEQPQRTVLRRTITSMLAGDVFGEDPAWRRFLRARYPVRLLEGP